MGKCVCLFNYNHERFPGDPSSPSTGTQPVEEITLRPVHCHYPERNKRKRNEHLLDCITIAGDHNARWKWVNVRLSNRCCQEWKERYICQGGGVKSFKALGTWETIDPRARNLSTKFPSTRRLAEMSPWCPSASPLATDDGDDAGVFQEGERERERERERESLSCLSKQQIGQQMELKRAWCGLSEPTMRQGQHKHTQHTHTHKHTHIHTSDRQEKRWGMENGDTHTRKVCFQKTVS